MQQLVSDKLSRSRQANGDLSSSSQMDVCFGLPLQAGQGGLNPPLVQISMVRSPPLQSQAFPPLLKDTFPHLLLGRFSLRGTMQG